MKVNKQEIKRRMRQPTTIGGIAALMVGKQIAPDVDWEQVIDAVMVLYHQVPIIVTALFGGALWCIFSDEKKNESA